MSYTGKFEFAAERRFRSRNTRLYRLAHWPIWIWVFFIAPGPLTFTLFSRGFHWINWSWLAAVLIGTGIAGLRGRLPGVEPCPYILRFDEDRPNPLYRRICYTFAWNAVLSYTLLNLTGLVLASATGVWHLKQIYFYAYSPLCAFVLLLGIYGQTSPRGTIHQGRRRRAALLLRFSLGIYCRPRLPPPSVESPSGDAPRQLRQAGRFLRSSGGFRPRRLARPAPTHSPHPLRRAHGLRLARSSRSVAPVSIDKDSRGWRQCLDFADLKITTHLVRLLRPVTKASFTPSLARFCREGWEITTAIERAPSRDPFRPRLSEC